jgi:hypothetical protein
MLLTMVKFWENCQIIHGDIRRRTTITNPRRIQEKKWILREGKMSRDSISHFSANNFSWRNRRAQVDFKFFRLSCVLFIFLIDCSIYSPTGIRPYIFPKPRTFFQHWLQALENELVLCQTRTTGFVDVVYVNIVTWSVGCERVGELAKGRAVVSRPGARVDGYSPPREKKLVLQVIKHGVTGSKGLDWNTHYMCKYCNICMISKLWDFCVQVKYKPCVRCASYMRSISWIHPLGSETSRYPFNDFLSL